MRNTVACFLLLLIVVAIAAAQDGPGRRSTNPFEGWDKAKIKEHRERSKKLVSDLARDWINARKRLVHRCGRCKGTGQIPEYVLRQAPKMVKCPTCDGEGGIVSQENFYEVFWNQYSKRYRTEKRKKKLLSRLKLAQLDPERAVEDLGVVSRCRRRKVEVLGNYATATFEVKVDDQWGEEYAIYIEEAPGKWVMFDLDADRGFFLIEYPGKESEDPEAAPAESPDEGEWTETGDEDGEAREDPSEIFGLAALKVRLVTGRKYRVTGSIENKSTRRRYAYIVVRVRLYKEDEIVEETTCSVEDAILDPSEFARFVGYFYWDERPDWDRISAAVIQYEPLD